MTEIIKLVFKKAVGIIVDKFNANRTSRLLTIFTSTDL